MNTFLLLLLCCPSLNRILKFGISCESRIRIIPLGYYLIVIHIQPHQPEVANSICGSLSIVLVCGVVSCVRLEEYYSKRQEVGDP